MCSTKMSMCMYSPPYFKETHADYITRILKHNIVFLQLKPGQIISENEIRVIFNVSRTPVREAFIRLSKENLLEIKPQQGTYISHLNKKSIQNFLFMRHAIELQICKEVAMLSISESYLAKLEENLQQQELLENHDPVKFITLDKQFHLLIYKSIGKEEIWTIVDSVQYAYDRLRMLFFQEECSYLITIQQHYSIFEALKNKDIKKIEELVDDHIGSQFELFKNQIENNNFFFLD